MKKIAITKNGLCVLKIIEMNAKDDMCDFKIVPCIQGDSLRIFSLKMFSLKEEYSFDSNHSIEISYHRDDGIHPTKIQIKVFDSNGVFSHYDSLPITRLIDPNIHTLFPIPLVKMTIPDSSAGEKIQHMNHYVEFDVGNNNIVELFMTPVDYNFESFHNGFPNFFVTLLDDSFEFFTTSIFNGYNMDCALRETGISGDAKNIMTGANITDDIGLWCVTVNDSNIHNTSLDLLFIENEFYVPICVSRLTTMRGKRELMYTCDLELNKNLLEEERKKYYSFFLKEERKFHNFIKTHLDQYYFIHEYDRRNHS